MDNRGKGYTGSRSRLTLTKEWLSNCLTEHSSCTLNNPDGWLPTRLLHVTSSQNGAVVRLFPRENIAPGAAYMTLSHCWGSGHPLQLTSATYNEFLSEVPIQRSKTFAEAASVVEFFGVDYLWIDSLCIIQDSVSDWRTESATMDLVYKYSLSNIAATGAVNDSGGLFHARYDTFLEPLTVRTGWANSKMENGWYTCLNPHHTWNSIYESRLMKRGWVLQEYFLSRRLLYCGQNMVFWECDCKRRSEAEPEGVRLHTIRNLLGAKGPDIANMLGRNRDEQRPNSPTRLLSNWFRQWGKLVALYSRSALTKPDDKLIAIAGAAKEMRSRILMPMVYLAGLWSYYLDRQLLWETGVPSGSRVLPYRAPSWSWASMDREIYFPVDLYNEEEQLPLTKIVDFHVTPLDQDQYLQVINGYIRINSWLWNARGVKNLPEDSGHQRLGFVIHIDDFVDENSFPFHEEDCFLLPILFERYPKFGVGFGMLRGLLIEPVCRGASYSRIGSFKLTFERNDFEIQPSYLHSASTSLSSPHNTGHPFSGFSDGTRHSLSEFSAEGNKGGTSDLSNSSLLELGLMNFALDIRDGILGPVGSLAEPYCILDNIGNVSTARHVINLR